MYASYHNFEELDIRVGTIISASFFTEAIKPAYKLLIDFGEEVGVKKSSAQLTVNYTEQDLFNKQVIAIINFKPKQIAHFVSECLVLGIMGSNSSVVLLKPDAIVSNGQRIG